MSEVTLSADGVPIHYEAQGQGTPALVFVHGWCCNRGHWRHQIERFAYQYTVVAVDLAGHGESGHTRDACTVSAFGQDVVAVVEKLNLAQVVLVGHSMGGPVIVEAARRIPSRVIGLIGADTFRDLERTQTQEEIEAAVARFRTNFVTTTKDLVRSHCFVPTSEPAFVEALVEELAAASPQVGIGAIEALTGADAALRAGFQEIQVPVYAINADYRPTNLEAAQRYGIQVRSMSDVGHFVMMEDPETFNQLFEEAIQQILRGSSGGETPSVVQKTAAKLGSELDAHRLR